MRLRTGKIWLIAIIGMTSISEVKAQVASNPLEWMALAEGNEQINGEIERRNRQTLWGGCTDANPKLLLNDT